MVNVGISLHKAPRLLHDIVLEILSAALDLTLVSLPADASILAAAVGRNALDALVVCPVPAPDEALALLNTHPGLTLVGLHPDGREASLVRLLPSTTTIELSAATLLAALRTPPSRGGRGIEQS